MVSIIDSADLTRSKARRRIVFFTLALCFVVLLVLRFLVVPWFAATPIPSITAIIEGVLDSLAIAVAASIAMGGLLYWLGATEQVPAEMRVIEPREIAETLQEALDATTEWWYRGHTGRHLRSVTLPALARRARRRNQSISVSIQVLDPSDEPTCESYAKYRRGLRTAISDADWTSDRVCQELYATILSAYEISGREPLLELIVAVHRTVSVYRVDLSSRLAIITKEDPKEPAIRCDAGTFFHASYREDLKMSREQGKELDCRVRIASHDRISVSDLRGLFRSLSLYSSRLDDDGYVSRIMELARDAKNPYP